MKNLTEQQLLDNYQKLLDVVEGVNLPISGFIDASMALGHLPAPLLWCSATPSSHVTVDAFERVTSAMLDRLANSLPVDAVYLDLHGAMVTEHHQDGEGELLARVRGLIGPQVPLLASLDLHANISPKMVDYTSAISTFGLIRTWIWPIRVDDAPFECAICLTVCVMKKPFCNFLI